MILMFCPHSPNWQINWFRAYWIPFWDSKLACYAVEGIVPKAQAENSLMWFVDYLQSLNFNAWLDNDNKVCVELSLEEYVLACLSFSDQ